MKISQQQINQPYYRVVCKPAYGGRLDDPFAKGTYWTPRWDGVVLMMKSIFRLYMNEKQKFSHEDWKTTIYTVSHAVMEDPPEEHVWAYVHSVDAGEQMLVSLIEQPQIIYQGYPDDDGFAVIMSERTEKLINFSKIQDLAILLNGETNYLYPDYNTKTINVIKPIPGTSGHDIVVKLKSSQEFEQFMSNISPPKDNNNAIFWAFQDFGWLKQLQENQNKERQVVSVPEPQRSRRSKRTPFKT